MAGEATIVSAGSVTISSTGAQTGSAIAQVANIVNAAGGNISSYDPTTNSSAVSAPAVSTPGAVYTIAEAATGTTAFSGTLVLPTGYAAVVLAAGTNVSVTGGDSSTAIVSAGRLDYDGNSSQIVALGNTSAIIDTGNQASIAVAGIGDVVTLGGAGQTLRIDGGAQGKFVEAGTGADIRLVASPAGAATTAGTLSTFQITDNTSLALGDSAAASDVVLAGGANTVSASEGTNTIFASTGNDVYFEGAAQSFFVGATGKQVAVSTIFGGTRNDTVFAQAGVNYTEGSGNNLFTGGSNAALNAAASVSAATAFHSTVTATTGHDLLFGGTVGDQYNLGNGSELFVGGGGADTMFGGSVAPTIFGGSNESLKLIGTNGGLIVASGDKDVIDASKADQGSTFFVTNVPSVLNTTLVGSASAPTLSGAHDTFVIGHAPAAVTTPGVAHTISIENFQTGDAFFLSGYTATDGAAFQTAVASADTAGIAAGNVAKGSVSFTLSDKTTVTFVGTHPTGTFNGGTVAL